MPATMTKTRYPGIYRRGDRYVVVWRHRGRQHKQACRTLAEAREVKAEKVRPGGSAPPTRQTVEDYGRAWIETYAGRTAHGLTERTREAYRKSLERHVFPSIGHLRMADVEPTDLRRLVADLCRPSDHRKVALAPASVRKHLRPMVAMFNTAVDDGALRASPAARLRVNTRRNDLEGEADDERAKALTRVQLAAFIEAVPEGHRLFFRLMAETGLRVSEAIGLNVGDVAFGTPTRVQVRRQCYRGTMDRLKTRNARRDVPVSADLARSLWPACANREADAPLFATRTGTRVSDTNLRRRVLNPAAQAAGVPWAGFHSLRHTCASRLLAEGGKNIAQVARWLGHADPGFTLRTYVHLMDEGLGDAEFLGAVPADGNSGATQGPGTGTNDPGEAGAETVRLQATPRTARNGQERRG
jgi:integrase